MTLIPSVLSPKLECRPRRVEKYHARENIRHPVLIYRARKILNGDYPRVDSVWEGCVRRLCPFIMCAVFFVLLLFVVGVGDIYRRTWYNYAARCARTFFLCWNQTRAALGGAFWTFFAKMFRTDELTIFVRMQGVAYCSFQHLVLLRDELTAVCYERSFIGSQFEII